MKTLIFAAGLGTRLKPLTDTMPKALVPVGGKPLLQHVMERLHRAGCDDFVVNVHHFADQIETWLHGHEELGVKVAVSDERDMLRDTGGGIRHAKDLLLEGDGTGQAGGFFLVHNVDIISDLDIRWFCGQARPDALAMLLVSNRQTSRYLLFDDDMRLVGWTNVRTGEVRSPYRDLDVARCRALAFSGIHLVSEGIFDVMDAVGRLDGSGHFGECFPIIDFYLAAAASCNIYGICADSLSLVDVGKPETLSEVELAYSV